MAANLSEKEEERVWMTYISHLPPALTIVPLSVLVFILVTNILILITFNRFQHLHLQHYLVIGLCLADAFTLAPTAIMSWTIANGSINSSDTGCGFMGLLFSITIGSTTWMHSAMSIERLVSVTMPVRHRLVVAAYNPKKLASVAISICLLSPMLSNIVLFYAGILDLNFHPYLPMCKVEKDLYFYCTIGILFVGLPLTTQLITNAVVIRQISQLRGRIRARKFKAIRTVLLTLSIYYSCWLLGIVEAIWSVLPVSKRPPLWMEFVIYNILFSKGGMSYLIYMYSLKDFRRNSNRICNSNTVRSTNLLSESSQSSGAAQLFRLKANRIFVQQQEN